MQAREAEQAGDRVAIVSWLQSFGRQAGARDVEVGAGLLAAERTRAYELAGVASIFQLAEQLLGWEGRTTHERLRVARALESLPLAAAALREGRIHWTKVRELSRVAVPETEAEWLAQAAAGSVRDLEAMVSGRRVGDRPGDPPDPELVKRRLLFEAGPELWGAWQRAVDVVRREVGEKLSEEEVLLHLLYLLRGAGEESVPTGEKRPPAYQVALTVCVSCKQGFQLGGGQETPVPDSMTERVACDAACIGFVDEEAAELGATAVERTSLPKAYAAHVGTRRRRKSRTVGAKTAERVRLRDQDRCRVPGCNHRLHTQIHHVQMVVDGGSDELENLVLLCGTHHRLLHEGRLFAIASAGRVDFYRADGSPYGTALAPAALEARADAFAVMRGLRFGEREARRLLADAHARLERGGVPVPSAAELAKEALRLSRRGKEAPVVQEEAAAYLVCPRGQGERRPPRRAHVGRAAA